MDPPPAGGLEVWRSGGLEVWRSGGLEVWRSGGLEVWGRPKPRPQSCHALIGRSAVQERGQFTFGRPPVTADFNTQQIHHAVLRPLAPRRTAAARRSLMIRVLPEGLGAAAARPSRARHQALTARQ
ncbi:hypothetical protein EYF80_061552 [Liparis tanakae]|uniref:Uncharacterized protein n=1 Tax=Liparis tanakae TaxID=230148 RepID=A0A4Z2EIA6_9TELE|nr:hypothetical protein EYF80_061552 [Liparis tanakae]